MPTYVVYSSQQNGSETVTLYPMSGSKQVAGWMFQILPYIEQDNLWQSPGHEVIGKTVSIYFCPSRREPMTAPYDINRYTAFNPACPAQIFIGKNDYAGSNYDGTGIFRPLPIVLTKDGKPPTVEGQGGALPKGVQAGSVLRPADVKDGLSNTLMVGEKRLHPDQYAEPDNYGDDDGFTAGYCPDTIRSTTVVPGDPPSGGPPQPDSTAPPLTRWNDWSFGSSHPAGMNALFGDGSVRLITYSVDATLFSRLGHRSDGAAVDLSKLE